MRTQADTEYLARELGAIRLALGEMPTREYLAEELEQLRSELERLRGAGGARPPARQGAGRGLALTRLTRSTVGRPARFVVSVVAYQ
jgi:hypothetical protein